MSSSRPSVFVSSTIHDLADMRSALKYWLEEQGYEPRFSEHNDFPKPLDRDSYSACLAAIESADYFVLLIGARRGGMYDKDISITRAEYRYAYERFKATGRPRILSFVRRSVWDVKEDRKALAKAVTKAPDLAAAAAIVDGAGSIIVDDPANVFPFIDEVKRAAEMREATKTGAGYPPGNWVHTFVGFRDIVDALRAEFRMGRSLRRAGLAANLRHEILTNIAQMVRGTKRSEGVTPSWAFAGEGHKKFVVSLDGKIEFNRQELGGFAIFVMCHSRVGESMTTAALAEAIGSTEFLEWDRDSGVYRVGPLQSLLLDLRRDIETLMTIEASLRAADSEPLRKALNQALEKRNEGRRWNIPCVEVMPVVNMRAHHINIVRLGRAIIKALDGSEAVAPRRETLKVAEKGFLTTEETHTLEEVERWLLG